MKRLSTLFIATLMASGAWAQASIPPAPVTGATPSAETKAPADAAIKPRLANPFTGVAATVEELQAELETARLRTAALEEQLKQTNLSQEISTVPLRKAVEAAQARASARAEMTKLEELERNANAAKEAAAREREEAAAARKASKAGKKNAKNGQVATQEQPVVAAPPPPPQASVMSVMSVGASRSVVLDFSGNTLVVEQGGMTPLGPVNIVDDNTVQLGGRTLKVSASTLSRYTRSETSTAAAGTANSLPSVTTTPVPAAAPTAGTITRPTAPNFPGSVGGIQGQQATPGAASASGMPGMPATLPPLQLPPGVSVLPASR